MKYFKLIIYILFLFILVLTMNFLTVYYLLWVIIAMIAYPVIMEIWFVLCYKKINFTIKFNKNITNRESNLNLAIKIRPYIMLGNCKFVLELHNKFYNKLEKSMSFQAAAFSPKTINIPIENVSLGKINAEINNIVVQDIFGLFSKTINVNIRDTVFVMPSEIINSEVIMGRSQITMDSVINNYSKTNGDISGVKNFVVGDRLNLINWKLSSKSEDVLYSKNFENNISNNFLVLFDFNLNYLDIAFDQMYSAVLAILSKKHTVNLLWLSRDSENLYVKEIKDKNQLDRTIKLLYNLRPINTDNFTINRFKQQFPNNSALYISKNKELV